jgi:predicted dehydrogenase
MSRLRFLVIGCGSIGQRHIKNLKSLGITELDVFDSNKQLSDHVKRKFHVNELHSLNFDNIDCTLICTPPSSHVQLAKHALKKGSHVFIEKPLSNSSTGLNDVSKLAKDNSLQVFVGYVFRFDAGLKKVKELLIKNSIGNILSFDAYEGWYLPKWRPWQDHTKSYTASEKLGGGIILDGSHELNYLQWLGGKVNQVFSYYSKVPKLKTKTEGIAEILLSFRSKAIGRIHLDFVNPKYNRHCEIIGDEGSIRWNFDTKTIEIQKSMQTNYKIIKYGKDNNEMYLSELRYVLDCLDGKKNNLITLSGARDTLEASIAIKKSGKINRPVSI